MQDSFDNQEYPLGTRAVTLAEKLLTVFTLCLVLLTIGYLSVSKYAKPVGINAENQSAEVIASAESDLSASVERLAVTTPLQKEEVVRIVFGGDMMFDRYIREKNHETGYLNSMSPGLKTYIKSFDGFVANLEGPITNYETVADYRVQDANHFKFTFDPAVTKLLSELGSVALSIGNNHSLNFGAEGLVQTESYIGNASLLTFGNPLENDDYEIVEIAGVTIGFVAYNEFDSIPKATTLENIATLEVLVDHTVVFPHWGVEYSKTARASDRLLAQEFIGAGADLIVGAHPHVVQNNEIIDGVPVFYSLGNLVFDQYFDSEVLCGNLVSFTFTKNDINFIENQAVELVNNGTTKLSTCGQ